MNRARGFTLLEVLVAMAVLALALAAVSKSAAGFITNQAYLRDRTYAEWVAHNQLNEIMLSRQWPGVGQQKDEVEYPRGDRQWRWIMKVAQTGEENLRRLDMEVYRLDAGDDEPPLAVLTAFMERP